MAREIARAAWGFKDLELPPVADLLAVTHAGGLTAGAFEAGRMLGFVHGIPRTNLEQSAQHSHLLAILPKEQGRGLAPRLKFYQRAWCLERGIRLVTWTYDPLLVKNAFLNLVRLKARAVAYLVDFYGPTGGIYGNLPTDRFEVHWRLDEPEVAEAAGERPKRKLSNRPTRDAVRVEISATAPALYAEDPKAARRARMSLRRQARRLFEDGYEATSIEQNAESKTAVYRFERTNR